MTNEKELEAEIDRLKEQNAFLLTENDRLTATLNAIHNEYNKVPPHTRYDMFAKLKAVMLAKQLIKEIECIGSDTDKDHDVLREIFNEAKKKLDKQATKEAKHEK